MFISLKAVEISEEVSFLDVSEVVMVNHLVVVGVEAEISVVVVKTSTEGRILFEVIAEIIESLAGRFYFLDHGIDTLSRSGYLRATVQLSISSR